MSYEYGYSSQIDPELLRRARNGPGIGQSIDAGLKSLTSGLQPLSSASYGVGSLPKPPALAAPDMAERLRSARPVSPLAAPDIAARLRSSPPTRTAGPSLPSPDYIAENPLYGAQTDQYRQFGDLRASGYQPIAQDSMTLRQIAHAPGFGPQNPNRVPGPGQIAGTTDYQIPGVGNATFQGRPAQMPGTLNFVDKPETAGMTQQQATAFNVRDLESQIAAMRSLREAQNPGITQPQSNGGIDLQDLQRQANPFYQPGQGYGDEVLNRDRFMRQFAGNRSGRMMRQQAEQGLAQLGNKRLNNLLDNALGQQQSQQDGQTALAQVWQKALADQQDYGLRLQNLGLDRAKFGLDARKAQDEAERAGIREQYANNLSALQAQKAATENAGLEQKGSLFNALRQAPNEDARQRALADLLAWHGRQADQPFGY